MRTFVARMSMPNQYVIKLVGRGTLLNECDYHLGGEYFEAIGDSVISAGEVDVHIAVMRYETNARLDVSIKGSVTVPCDRCLNEMTIEISSDEELKVVYGDHYEDDGETITIDERDGRIDLANILFELIALQVPLQHTHRDGECDEQMAGKLREWLVESA